MPHAELAPFGTPFRNQRYALVSFVSPTSTQKADTLGFRLYAACDTLDEARAHAAAVNAEDSTFDVYVVEMYKWCAWHPDPASIPPEDTVYSDRRLGELISEHNKAQQIARGAFNERMQAPLE
jgi:hypothetical protein